MKDVIVPLALFAIFLAGMAVFGAVSTYRRARQVLLRSTRDAPMTDAFDHLANLEPFEREDGPPQTRDW